MGYQDILDEIIKLSEKYVKIVGERKNIFKTLRRKSIEKKIIEKFEKFCDIIPLYILENILKPNNVFEYSFEKSYKNKSEKIEVITKARLKFKYENYELKLLSVKFEKSINLIS
ncbi:MULTISPECIES: hypothetical protein [Bacteria]|uniref:Uncharacterized protein n=1 Tax=Planomonospora alba TaxID=161354 RepID=A0ABP6NY82_9ACTN|nr:hypothetical protein [Sulfolobus islandicus]